MHENQLRVTVDMVRELIDDQFPQWASRPIAGGTFGGTVSAIFRIGDNLAARFPLLPGDVAVTRRRLQSEADAARQLPSPIRRSRTGGAGGARRRVPVAVVRPDLVGRDTRHP